MSFGDLLYAFTEWLRSTQLVEFAFWLQNTGASTWLASHFWAIPIMQTLHILAIAASFGSVTMIAMRVLNLAGGGRTMSATVRRYLPWVWWALAALVVTGIGMVVGEPPRELINPVFWLKMVLVIVAALISLWFTMTVRRGVATWETTHDGRVAIRIGAVGTVLLWCVIMFAGRWIAYAPV